MRILYFIFVQIMQFPVFILGWPTLVLGPSNLQTPYLFHSQLSISRKMSSSNATGSLDDLFLASSPSMENKRASAYTEAFIEALTAPDPNNVQLDRMRQRRVSAPTSRILPGKMNLKGSLDQVFEETEAVESTTAEVSGKVALDIGLPTSYSYDDIAQLKEDAELVAPPKWARPSG